MDNKFVTVRNSITGRVGKVRRRIAEHPIHGLPLEIVPDGSKDLIRLTDLVDKKRHESENLGLFGISADEVPDEDDTEDDWMQS